MSHVFNTRHGEYVLASRIAVGGMAEVYLALHPAAAGMDRFVALKCMHPHLHDEPKVVEMFYREARLGALFRNPHLVRVDDVRLMEGRHTMVMEFAPGVTLREVLDRMHERQELFPTPYVFAILRQILDALFYAHSLKRADGVSMGIVHRDLTPDNVLIGFDGEVKLLDFGVAAAATTSNDATLTGTVAYMAPEQIRGEPLDLRADLFSVGTLFWEMIQGESPYPRTDRIRALRMITETTLPAPAATTGRDGSEEIDALWQRFHAKEPNERFPDARAAMHALNALEASRGASTLPALDRFISRLFPHESAELRTLQEKILRTPPPTEHTIELSDSASFPEPTADDDSPTREAFASDETQAWTPQPNGTPVAARPVDGPKPPDRPTRAILIVAIVLLAALLIGAFTLVWVQLRAAEPAPRIPAQQVIDLAPAGAVLQVAGASLEGGSRVVLLGTVGDVIALRAHAPGYLPREQQLQLVEDADTVAFHLERDPRFPEAPVGELWVHYTPEDAELSINGELRAGQSPADLRGIPLEKLHVLRLAREGYQTLFVDLQLTTSERQELNLELVEGVTLSRLSVNSDPEGATVLLDGQPVGETPLEALQLPAFRTYAVELQRAGYQGWKRALHLSRDDRRLDAKLTATAAPRPTRGARPQAAGTSADEPEASSAPLPYRMLD